MKIMNKIENDDPYALALREMYGVAPDIDKVINWLNQAIEKGDARAEYALATWYLSGTNVRKSLKKGVRLLRLAASHNNCEALYDLAVCYEKGDGTNVNEKKSFELYLRSALWGEKQSFFEVGRMLYYGIGTKQDRRLARIWIDRAKSLDSVRYNDAPDHQEHHGDAQ